MVTAFATAVPPAVLPAGATVLVSVGTPLVIAMLLAALVAIGAVLIQGAASVPPKQRPPLRVVMHAPGAASSRDAARVAGSNFFP